MPPKNTVGLLFEISTSTGNTTQQLKKIDNRVNRLARSSKGLSNMFGKLLSANLVADAFRSIARTSVEAGKAIFDYSKKIEQARVRFETLTGSAQLAHKTIKDIQNFAKTTPFEFADLADFGAKLRGANVEISNLIPLMKDIGNAVSAVGGDTEAYEGAVRAITQIISKSKVSAEEMQQLAERNINLWAALAEELGFAEDELGKVRKLVEDGKVDAQVLVQVLQKVSREKWGDAMAKQARTMQGAITRIKDTFLREASTAFEPWFNQASTFAADLADEIQDQSFSIVVDTIAERILGAIGGTFGEIGGSIAKEIVKGLTESLTSEASVQGLVSAFAMTMRRVLTIGDSLQAIIDNFIAGFWAQILGFDQEKFKKAFREGSKAVRSVIDPPVKQKSIADLRKSDDTNYLGTEITLGKTEDQLAAERKKREQEQKKQRAAFRRAFSEELKALDDQARLGIQREETLLDERNDLLKKSLSVNKITIDQFGKAIRDSVSVYQKNVQDLITTSTGTKLADILFDKEGAEKNAAIASTAYQNIITEQTLALNVLTQEGLALQEDLDDHARDILRERVARELRTFDADTRRMIAKKELEIAFGKETELELLKFEQEREIRKLTLTRDGLEAEQKLHEEGTAEYIRLGRERDAVDKEITTRKIEHEAAYKEALDASVAARAKETDELERQVELLREKRELEEQTRQEKIIDFEPGKDKKPGLPDDGHDIFTDIFGADPSEDIEGNFKKKGEVVQDVFTSMKDVAVDSLKQMGAAVGESVAQWVLYGDSIGKALKKALASQLAHIAAMATVKALESAAWGFYHLATFNFPAAANAFIAAGLWGALAVGSALAGRAVAGNAFSGASDTATGDIDLRDSNNAGNDPLATTSERVQRQENRIEILLRTERGWFGQALRNDVSTGGEGSGIILRMIEEGG